MSVFKRMFILLIIPVLLLVSFPSNVFASSEYDSVISKTNSLIVQYSGMDDVDVTSEYMAYFTKMTTSHDYQYRCLNDDYSSTSDPTQCLARINESFDNGDWFIYTRKGAYPSDYQSVVGVFCPVHIDSLVGHTDNTGGSYGLLEKSIVAYFNDYTICEIVSISWSSNIYGWYLDVYSNHVAYQYNSFDIGRFVSSTAEHAPGVALGYTIRPYLLASDASWPTDYEGDKPPSTGDPTVRDEVYVPQASFAVDKLNVRGLWCLLSTCGDLPVGLPPVISWHIEDEDGEIIYQPDEPSSLSTDNGVFEYNFDGLGTFYLVGDFVAPIPYIKPDNQEWVQTRLQILIDGRTYVSGTIDQNCEDGSSCEGVQPMEDCSFGITELFNGITCLYHNYQNWLVRTFSAYFIPKSGAFNHLTEQFGFWADEHLGMIVQFNGWMSVVWDDSLSMAHDRVCLQNFGKFFNRDFILNKCVVEDNYPAVWGVVSFAIRATVVMAVLLYALNRLKFAIGKTRRG